MGFCQFCAGTDYTLLNNGSLIICNICQRRFNREDDPLVEEISEPATHPDMGTGDGGDSVSEDAPTRSEGSRNKRKIKLRGCAKTSKQKKMRQNGEDISDETVTYTGGYIQCRMARSRRANALMKSLREDTEQLNTECGYGVVLVASAQLPLQGPRAKGVEIFLKDKDGKEPQWSGGNIRHPEVSNKNTTYKYPHNPFDSARKLTPSKERTTQERRSLSDSLLSPFGPGLNISGLGGGSQAPDVDETLVTYNSISSTTVQTACTLNSVAQRTSTQSICSNPNPLLSASTSNLVPVIARKIAPSQARKTVPAQARKSGFQTPVLIQSELDLGFNIDTQETYSTTRGTSISNQSPVPNQLQICNLNAVTQRQVVHQNSVSTQSQAIPLNTVSNQSSILSTGTVPNPYPVPDPVHTTAHTTVHTPAPNPVSNLVPDPVHTPGDLNSKDNQSLFPGSSKPQVKYNPLHHIKISGLAGKEMIPDISLVLRPVVCEGCKVERKSTQDKAYRRDNLGRARGIGRIGDQWVNCSESSCSYWSHASCLFSSKEIPSEIKYKKDFEDLVFYCCKHR